MTMAVAMSLGWWRQEQAVDGSERVGGGRRRTHNCSCGVAARTTVPWHCRLSLSCSSDNGSGANNGILSLLAIPCLLARWQQRWWWGQQCLGIVGSASLACTMEEAMAMLPCGGQPADNTTRGGVGGGNKRQAGGGQHDKKGGGERTTQDKQVAVSTTQGWGRA